MGSHGLEHLTTADIVALITQTELHFQQRAAYPGARLRLDSLDPLPYPAKHLSAGSSGDSLTTFQERSPRTCRLLTLYNMQRGHKERLQLFPTGIVYITDCVAGLQAAGKQTASL